MKIENPMKRSEKSLTKEISRKTSTTRRPAPKVPLLPSLAVMAVLFIAGIFIGTRLTLGHRARHAPERRVALHGLSEQTGSLNEHGVGRARCHSAFRGHV